MIPKWFECWIASSNSCYSIAAIPIHNSRCVFRNRKFQVCNRMLLTACEVCEVECFFGSQFWSKAKVILLNVYTVQIMHYMADLVPFSQQVSGCFAGIVWLIVHERCSCSLKLQWCRDSQSFRRQTYKANTFSRQAAELHGFGTLLNVTFNLLAPLCTANLVTKW